MPPWVCESDLVGLGRVAPFPWHRLRRLSRRSLQEAWRARRAVARGIDLRQLAAAIHAVGGGQLEDAHTRGPTQVELHEVRTCEFPDDELLSARATLEIRPSSTRLYVGLEATLAIKLLGRLLDRPIVLSDPRGTWSPTLQGALEALVLEVARRAGPQHAAGLLVVPPVPDPDAVGVLVTASLMFEGCCYPVSAWVVVRELHPDSGLVRLPPGLPVALPLVVGWAVTTREELESLRPGDAWSCGDGWWIDTKLEGHGLLAAPGADVGQRVELKPDGVLVLGDNRQAMPVDIEDKEASGVTKGKEGLDEAVLEAPVVVRVELGCVSMLAREWAELQPGDVIQTGQRVGEPARLRVAGCEVARGELVDVDGELGVRITALSGTDSESS